MKAKWEWPGPTQILAWIATLTTVILAVTPILPPTTPEWVRVTLGIAAVVGAKLAQSERKLPPTIAEATARLDKHDADSLTRETLPPGAP